MNHAMGKQRIKRKEKNPTLAMWLSWLEHHPIIKKLKIQFPVRAFIRSPVQVHTGGNQSMLFSYIDASLTFSVKAMKKYP